MDPSLCGLFDTILLRRQVSQYLSPADWDILGPCCKSLGSQVKVHGTGFWFPLLPGQTIPAASYTFDKKLDAVPDKHLHTLVN